jgi:hypothetical protein
MGEMTQPITRKWQGTVLSCNCLPWFALVRCDSEGLHDWKFTSFASDYDSQ